MTEEEIPSTPPANEAAEEVQDRTQQLEIELKECHEKHLRLLAEVENSKKRMIKEKQEMTRFGIENVIADFLKPLDNLENALRFTAQMSEETRNWAIGFEMILTQFKDALKEHDIASFSSIGESFDPHLHEAVEIQETCDVAEGQIIQEFVRGYKSGQRVLRPARVKVAKAPQPTNQEEEKK
jgi:molecular chaperone GrpE